MIAAMYKYLLLCFCFLACRKATTTYNAGNPVTVKLNECVDVQRSNRTIKVCIDSVSDSRCPFNALCIWAGVAIVKLRVTGAAVHSFQLSTISNGHFPPTDTTIENHRLYLTKVLPYPGDGSNLSPRIELNVD